MILASLHTYRDILEEFIENMLPYSIHTIFNKINEIVISFLYCYILLYMLYI